MAIIDYHITFECKNLEDENVILELKIPGNKYDVLLKSIGSKDPISLFIGFSELRDVAKMIVSLFGSS